MAQTLRESLALYSQSEDLIQLGAHIEGKNRKLDASIQSRDLINQFLRQETTTVSSWQQTLSQMGELVGHLAPK